eukprot:1297324-Karenia_brevis.AAC.1
MAECVGDLCRLHPSILEIKYLQSVPGTGSVQYRDPRSLEKAWNARQVEERCGLDPKDFWMWRESSRNCEPSTREFHIQEIEGRQYGHFTARCHLEPKSEEGRAFMRDEEGGWKLPPYSR